MPHDPDDGSPFFQLARAAIQQANFALNVHVEEPDRILSHYDRLSHLVQIFVRLSETYNEDDAIMTWIETIIETQRRITEHLEVIEEYTYDLIDDDAAIIHPIMPTFETIPTGGRPRISLPWETITVYRSSNHSWTEIASILGIHPRTLRRYRLRYNYQDPNPYSAITDEELDEIVARTLSQTSGVIGSKFMSSVLQDQGHRVVRRRVRESMARVDILGNLERWASWIPRSVYSVRGPNSLWHMDGNLKLKDYGFVLHGAIDGYSRRIIYLEANTDNRASTVLKAFVDGVNSIKAVPQRVRADKGKENRDVALWMLTINGVGRGSFITGRSVHNQRIERLWRDVNRWLTTFHLVFNYLRLNSHYDPDDDVDRFSMIFVYLPILRRSLSQFSRIWNNHKLRTEQHRTPIQLYAHGNPESLWMPANEMELEQYGIDWNGPVPSNLDDELDSIMIEPPIMPLADRDWNILVGQYRDQLHPEIETMENNLMSPTTNYGVDMYLDVREWIETRIATYG